MAESGTPWADSRQRGVAPKSGPMIRISISIAAFEALAATLPLGTAGYESEPSPNGERWIWLEETWLNKLDAIRMPGESYSDVILWLVEIEGRSRNPSSTMTRYAQSRKARSRAGASVILRPRGPIVYQVDSSGRRNTIFVD
jgi:hypothetical protein